MPIFITNTKVNYKPKSFFHCRLPLTIHILPDLMIDNSHNRDTLFNVAGKKISALLETTLVVHLMGFRLNNDRPTVLTDCKNCTFWKL